jgi:tRNA dimethylallyltransferase
MESGSLPGGERQVFALVGPTASGKTSASIAVAEALEAEIVSVDSTNIYRGIDVGTAKPTAEERARVPHHLLDVADPGEEFSVARFQALARTAISEIRSRHSAALLVGGSGLYYRAVVDGLEFPGTLPAVRRQLETEAVVLGPERLHERLVQLDPEAATRIEPRNIRRTVRALEVAAVTGRSFSSFYSEWETYRDGTVIACGVEISRPALHRRIEARASRTMPALFEETEALVARGHSAFIRSAQIIGYAEAMECLEGSIGEEEALRLTVKRIKALARRQMAWFRRDPRIVWFEAGEEGATGIVVELIHHFRSSVPGARARATMDVETS